MLLYRSVNRSVLPAYQPKLLCGVVMLHYVSTANEGLTRYFRANLRLFPELTTRRLYFLSISCLRLHHFALTS